MAKKKKKQEKPKDDFLRDEDGNIEYLHDDRPFHLLPEPSERVLSAEERERIRQRHIKFGIKD